MLTLLLTVFLSVQDCLKFTTLGVVLLTMLWTGPSQVEAAKVVNYTFEVTYFEADPDCTGITWVQGINGAIPGPEIRVQRYDRLRVTVLNQLQVEEVAVHWHGFEHRASQEYDGAMGVTMCGIKPRNTFVYDFVVDEAPGTYQYHDHAGSPHVAASGLLGSLVVEDADGVQPLWKYDRDVVLNLFEWWPQSQELLELRNSAKLSTPNTQSAQGNAVGLLPFHNILINGKGTYNAFGQQPISENGWLNNCTHIRDLFHIVPTSGETLRLRIINGGMLYAMRFRIDGHRLRVIQSDAADVVEYETDAVILSSGERFDVLVKFDRKPGSYWVRVETLEGHGLHHGQLGVVRYQGTASDIEPDQGFHRRHQISETPDLVTLGCVDQAPISRSCRPITDLRRHPQMKADVGSAGTGVRRLEVGLRQFGGNSPSHFTRVLDGRNDLGSNQFEGEYVQFHLPFVPYSHVGGSHDGEHSNTLSVHLAHGETVHVILQWQDRIAHPWHLHGHKFAVLGVYFPDFTETCDVLYCRSNQNAWINRDGLPALLDPSEAPLKDTVHVPAGGWAVVQFKADNPGFWLFHCHMRTHALGGMGLVFIEGKQNMPARLTNVTYLNEKGFPSCKREVAHAQRHAPGFSCSCWQNPEMMLDNMPLNSYRCSKPHLCETTGELDGPVRRPLGARDRASGRTWRWAMVAVEVSIVICMIALKAWMQRQGGLDAGYLEAASELVDSKDIAEQFFEFRQACRTRKSFDKEGKCMSQAISIPSATQESHGIRFPQYRLPVTFRAMLSCEGESVTPMLQGHLPAGSVCLLLGWPVNCQPWLSFFAGRSQRQKNKVVGELKLCDVHENMWSRKHLRTARCYIARGQRLRGSLSVSDILKFPLDLAQAGDVFETPGQQLFHFAAVVKLFNLEPHLNRKVAELTPDVSLLVRIAQQCMLPRGFIVLQDPLAQCDQRAATKMMELFAFLASEMGMSVILSGSSVMGNACFPVDRIMLLANPKRPFYGTPQDLRQYCLQLDQEVPSHMHVIEWCSELVSNGKLTLGGGRDTLQMRAAAARRSFMSAVGNLVKRMSSSKSADDAKGQRIGEKLQRACGRTGGFFHDLFSLPVCFRRQSVNDSYVAPYRQRCFLKQCWVVFRYEFRMGLSETVTVYKVIETFGIGAGAGLVWYRKFSIDTQTALQESIGLIFYSVLLWTLPPIFQALAAIRSVEERANSEYLGGFYHIQAFVIGSTASFIFTGAVWCMFWQIVAYAMADAGKSWQTVLMNHGVLLLHVLAFRSIGNVLGVLCPNSSMNTVIGTILSQMCMLTCGFYTKLQPWLQWITVFSIPRYTFRALIKLEYSWRDSFAVQPLRGVPMLGFPAKYIGAETTSVFQVLRDREMDVMQSPEESSILAEVVMLFSLCIVLTEVFAAVLLWRFQSEEADQFSYFAEEDTCESPSCKLSMLHRASEASTTNQLSVESSSDPVRLLGRCSGESKLSNSDGMVQQNSTCDAIMTRQLSSECSSNPIRLLGRSDSGPKLSTNDGTCILDKDACDANSAMIAGVPKKWPRVVRL